MTRAETNSMNGKKQIDNRWPDSSIEYLKENYNKMPARKLGENLGKSKNAVIGKARREGLSNPYDDKIEFWPETHCRD